MPNANVQNNAIVFRPGVMLRRQLEAIAQAQEMTLSDVVRAACTDYVVNASPTPEAPVPFLGVMTGGKEDALLWSAIKKVFQEVLPQEELREAA